MESNEGYIENPVVKSERIKEIVDSRDRQTITSRLCEYATGMKIEDEGIFEKLAEDQEKVRAKYGLPSREYRMENTSDYEDYLEKLAELNDVKINQKSECGSFFEENRMAGAVYFSENNTIGVDIDKTDESKYNKSVLNLEHETIHSLQHRMYPDLPIEVQEYEAYVASWNVDYLRENSDALDIVFSFGVGGSVNSFYQQLKEEGHEVTPPWKSADFFLENVDGLDTKDIENYRETKSIEENK